MNPTFICLLLVSALGQTCLAQEGNPYSSSPKEYKLADILDSCNVIVAQKTELAKGNYPGKPQSTTGGYFDSIVINTPEFMVPTLCDLMCAHPIRPAVGKVGAPYYLRYVESNVLSNYNTSIIPRIADVYVSPLMPSLEVQDKNILDERRTTALALLIDLTPLKTQGTLGLSSFFHQQGEQYRTYANRMQSLAEEIEDTGVPTFVAPALDTRPTPERIRRACEILLALEDNQNKALSPMKEAALIKELGSLRQDFSAPTLVRCLSKAAEFIDETQVKGALLALGESAIPEIIRFLREDNQSPLTRQQALSVLTALCKSPEVAKTQLKQAAQIYKEGASLFDQKAALMRQ